ncbi:MAG: IS982 family transposase [Chloroflexota bacterium]|nr:IS982 family transposase [Chloroflexota bacterium]
MIAEFDDFCLWMYVIVDELWRQLPPAYKPTSGPEPDCSDSELLTMALVGECRGWAQETELLKNWRERRHLFPVVPERSRFNRRRRGLMHAINAIRQGVLAVLDLAQDRQGAIDSLPVPVLQFHLVPGSPSAGTWRSEGAAFGKVPTKQQTIFGYKLHLLVTLNGLIRDFVLAPANASDVTIGEELLRGQRDLAALGDKGYVSAPLAAALQADCGVTLLTVPRRTQREQLPADLCRLLNRWRQIIETVNDQLTEQFAIGRHHAHTFWGLCARLYTKLAAHTLCVYLNRLTGAPDCLQIKALALPTN